MDRRRGVRRHGAAYLGKHALVTALPGTVADTAKLLADHGYIADLELATTVHLALTMQRPLFLEGEPGTGKTEIAKVLADGLSRRLVRLQCYDGMDLSAAAVPFGLFFGRLANFVNGEIYGRLTNVPWAVEFPPSVLLK